MTLEYAIKRIAQFLIVAFVAASVNFFFPRMTGQDPIAQKLAQLQISGGAANSTGMKEMIAEYNKKFGLDRPLWQQYLTYLGDTARLDFGQSITSYPATVMSLLQQAIPWSLGLLTVATLISFAIGTLAGAWIAWGKAPWFVQAIFPVFFTFSAVPFYLMGILLLYVLAFRFQIFPLFGGYSATRIPGFNMAFWVDVAEHSMLPALSIVLASIGFWALGMRSLMVSIQGEDYMLQAEAKGLKGPRIFFRYAVRNAILPQITGLALTLGTIISGAILVEVVFGYPGVGTVLLTAIRGFDWFVLQGVVFMVIVSVAFTMLIIDLLYPFLDPRINYRRE